MNRRQLIIGGAKITGAAIVSPFVLTGCPQQNQVAALVGIAGTAIASLETIEGNTDRAAQIQQDFNLAQTAVLNWKTGSPTEDVAQALLLVQNDLSLLPVSVRTQAYIELALGTVQSILDLFPATTQPAFAVTAKVARVQIVAPKTAAEFKKSWNAIGGIAPPLK